MLQREHRPAPMPTRTRTPRVGAVVPARAAGVARRPANVPVPVPVRSATVVRARILPATRPVARPRWPRRVAVGGAVAVVLGLLAALGWVIVTVVLFIAAHLAEILAGLALLALLAAWAGLGRAGLCPGIHCPGCKCGGR